MKTYCVRVTETGYAHVEVEAENAADAEQKVRDMQFQQGVPIFPDESYEYDYDISELDENGDAHEDTHSSLHQSPHQVADGGEIER
jgi:hypothetical protein